MSYHVKAVTVNHGTSHFVELMLRTLFYTNDLSFIVSSKRINHFTETTYVPERRAPKDRDCLKLLRELRAGRGMTLDLFWDSDWDKQ